MSPRKAPAETLDPAAADVPVETGRDGAKKRRDPNQPAAVVGLGASAGGVAVLQQFFSDIPAESGLAFVVVMHLSPDFESQLPSVLQQKTSMPVVQVSGPVKVRPNHVYVIPPNHQLTFSDSTLELLPPQQEQGKRVTIDLFFRTLAQAYGQRAVCIIMSGSDSDGVIGLKHIRAQGGVTIAQDPKEAEFESMPAMAIETGMVDWILPVAEMPAKLMEFVQNEDRMQLPPEIPEAEEADAKVEDAPGGETVSNVTRDREHEAALDEIMIHLRERTGHDFSHYKRATVLRRIARRLQVNSLETLPEYVEFLRVHGGEARALLQDLLIGVTHFFRDQEAFASLEENIPQLFNGKGKEEQLRVWVAGCATGEEAYSIAMLFSEYAERLPSPPSIQIFATDVDEEAIHDAREGIYPATIEADVSAERLRRFFVKDQGRYRVKKEIREQVLFAPQDLLRDVPFSRLDLVTCRNLLIYLKRSAQEQAFDIFHFALRAGGLLFIGSSETGGNAQGLFSPVDAKHRVYVRRSVPRPSWRMPELPARAPFPLVMPRSPMLPAMTAAKVESAGDESRTTVYEGQERRAVLFGELHLKLLEHYGSPSVLINEAHDIVHLSEKAGRYLRFVAGAPSANLLEVINPSLRVELRTALYRSAQMQENIIVSNQTVELESGTEVIDLHIRPIRPDDSAHGFFLVLFETKADPLSAAQTRVRHEAVNRDLDDELHELKRQLNATVEQYEASSEELKASNEELQAMNEEMRSTAEELETSKEELESVNEELITVNHELKEKLEELNLTNSDLQNLMSATEVGTIFLDRNLHIKRFTPRVQEIFNLLPSDSGRPISDITHKLSYDALASDAQQVLEKLTAMEREVRAQNERVYRARIAPYRTLEDRISGVVLTFVDITEAKRAEEEARLSAEQFRRALEDAPVPVIMYAEDGAVLQVSRAWVETTGYGMEDMPTFDAWLDRVYGDGAQSVRARLLGLLVGKRRVEGIEFPIRTRKRGVRYWNFSASTPGTLRDGRHFIVGMGVDITDRKHAEEALRFSEERFRQFAENSADVFWILNAKTNEVEYINPVYEKMFGQPREEIMRDRKAGLKLVHPNDREETTTGIPRALAGETFVRNYRIIRPTDGEMRWIRDTGFPIRDDGGEVVRIAGVAQDVTEEKERTEQLRESEEKLRLLIDGAPDYAMMMLDPANHIIYWSSGAERVFGWKAKEVLGKSGELIFTPQDRAKEAEEKEIATARVKGSAPDKRWHLRKDGTRIWIDGVMHRLDDENGQLRGYAKVARDATEERKAAEALRGAHDELELRVHERTRELQSMNDTLEAEMRRRQMLERQLLEISERERARISQDLHDSLCQELTATAFLLSSRAKSVGKKQPQVSQLLKDAAKTVNDNASRARDLARGLHPFELGAAGLVAALRELAARSCEHVTCRCECPRSLRIPDDNTALNLYRIAQEAVSNAIKHAKASEVVICIAREGDEIVLSVRDNGKRVVPKKPARGLGIHTMRYRANVSGGRLQIESKRGRGTKVTCRVPARP